MCIRDSLGTFILMIYTFCSSWVTPGPDIVKQQHTPCTTKEVTARTSELVRRRSSERHTRKNARCEHRCKMAGKCKVRTPMQDGGANTNPNSNGPKLQRMNIYYNHVLCAVSVLLFLFSLVLVFAPSNCVSVLLLLCLLLLVLAPLCSLAPSLARSLCFFPLA